MAISEHERKQLDAQYRDLQIKRVDRAVSNASYRDPDNVAENMRLSDTTRIPYLMVEQDQKEARRIERLKLLEPYSIPERSPKTAAWLAEERNASVAFDDIENLEHIERSSKVREERRGYWNNQSRGIANTFSQIVAGAVNTPVWVAEQASKVFTRPSDEIYGWITGKRGSAESTLAGARDSVIQTMTDAARQDEKFYDFEHRADIKGIIDSPTPANIANFIAQEGPSQIPYLIAAGVSYPLIVGVVANQVAEERVTNDKRNGLASDKDRAMGLTTSAVTGLIDRWSALKLFKSGKFPSTSAFAPYAVKELAKGTGREFGTEFVQEGVEAIGGSIGTETGVQPGSVFEQALSGGILGGGTGAGVRGLTVYPEYAEKVYRAAVKESFNQLESSEVQDWLDDHITYAQSAKTNERSPEQFKNFIESLDPEDHVLIDADIASSIEDAPQYIVDQLDGTGADVSISMKDFMTDFAPDEERLSLVRPYVKLKAEHLNQEELSNLGDSEQVKRLVEKANKQQAVQTESQAVYEQVKDQIVGTRRQGEHTARLSAQLIPAYITTKQAELSSRGINRTITELYEDMGLTIVGPKGDITGGKATLEQDEQTVRNRLEGRALEEFDYIMESFTEESGIKPGAEWKYAFTDLVDAVDTNGTENFTRKEIAQVRELAIELGIYREVSDEELANTTRIGGRGKKYDFVQKGKKYVFDKNIASYDYDVDEDNNIEIENLLQSDVTTPGKQDFGDLELAIPTKDAGGNEGVAKIKAQKAWDYHQRRLEVLEQLRACVNG